MPIASLKTTSVSRHISVFLGGKDVTDYVLQNTLEVEDSMGSGSQGSMRATLDRKLSQLPELSPFDFVRVIDHDAGTDLFRGFITSYRPVKVVKAWDSVEVTATDHGVLLDNYFEGPYKRPAESVIARVGYFWGIMTPWYLNQSLDKVTASATLPKATYGAMSLRRILDEVADDTSAFARWYLDQAGKLHFFTAETNTCPFDITTDTPGGVEIAPHDLRIDWDAADYFNAVYVRGGNAEGSGWVYDQAAIAKAGVVVRTFLDYPNSLTAARRDAVGLRHIGWFTLGMMRGSFTCFSPDTGGLPRAGMALNVRSSQMSINGASRIVKVRTSLESPTVRRYEIEFGATRRGFAKRFRK